MRGSMFCNVQERCLLENISYSVSKSQTQADFNYLRCQIESIMYPCLWLLVLATTGDQVALLHGFSKGPVVYKQVFVRQ
jgi:hypothetical protein